MVQEVQTGVGVYNETTLETIEAIGTSSFKIVEGRQTKGGHYGSSASASGNIRYNYTSGDSRQSPNMFSTNLTINTTSGKIAFQKSGYGIRVPAAGTYRVTFNATGGASTYRYNIYIVKVQADWGYSTAEKIISFEHNISGNVTDSGTALVDLGKFDVIAVYGNVYYGGSAGSATVGPNYSLTIEQL